jgi:hypothetical protein
MGEKHSKARELAGYSFLVVFANDRTIDENELHFMEKLALEDGQVDEEEKQVLRSIFSRVSEEDLTAKVLQEITEFREKYDI